MRVIVVGCGRVGSGLAIKLDHAGHDVAIIDKNQNAFRKYLPAGWAGRAIHGFGFDRDHLEEAGIRDADALAAVTSGDNSNILSARIARETYQVPSVVARIYDPRRALIYQRLGIPTVATVTWTTDQVMRRLFPETAGTEWIDPTGQLALVERSVPDELAGRRLADLYRDAEVRPVMVTRAGRAQLVTDDLVGQEGDILHLLGPRDSVEKVDGILRPAGAATRP